MNLVERFVSKVTVMGECWVWTGGYVDDDGYGHFHIKRRPVRAHRFAYALVYGRIPDGLTIDHLCRNRACVRPNHLEALTSAVNVLRGDTIPARNAAKTVCLNDHPFSPENTYVTNGKRFCRACVRERNHQWKVRTTV